VCHQLADALNNRAVVAAVGPICTEVLRFFGVTPDVVPTRPKLGPLMNALATYYRGIEHSEQAAEKRQPN
jgi:uroporphyrinogen-III synthase